ncbi:MAG: DUF4296 domain-containing protein [Candidatus Cryptobacteroides sp.]
MRKFLVISVLLSLALLSCNRGGKVIPKDDFAKIYARMLLVDQWVRENAPRQADTCLVYAPVLAEFGYDRDDYIASVNYYMENPESFGKIFTNVEDILQKRIDELTYVERRRAYLDSLKAVIEAKDFRRVEIRLDRCRDSVRVDSVNVVMDSTGVYVWERVPLDTVYYGPVWYAAPKDSADSLVVAADSLPAVHSDGGLVIDGIKPHRPQKTDMDKVVIKQLPVDSTKRRLPPRTGRMN